MPRIREQFPGFAVRLAQRMIFAGYARQTRSGRLQPDITRFAKEIGVTRKAAYSWVYGRSFPRHHLQRICALLSVSDEDLLYAPPGAPTVPLLRPPTVAAKLSTGYPEVDAMVAFVRGKLTELWEEGDEAARVDFMAHFARQVDTFVRHVVRRPPTT